MSSEVEEEERRPLIGHDLGSSILIVHQNEDTISICPLPQSNPTATSSLSLPNQRLSSLDVFRGLTVAVRPHYFSSIISCLLLLPNRH